MLRGANYAISVEYGDLLETKNCKKVIPFDECFTISVGDSPADINSESISGQYLEKNPIRDMQTLIRNAQLQPAKSKSKYQKKERYELGELVPNGDCLLMSFAKLSEGGMPLLFYEEFCCSLWMLWREIDRHYGQKDVCIPVLGSGVVLMDEILTNQQLLDVIISSYMLSRRKIKLPNKLRIVCEKDSGISLNKIGGNI